MTSEKEATRYGWNKLPSLSPVEKQTSTKDGKLAPMRARGFGRVVQIRLCLNAAEFSRYAHTHGTGFAERSGAERPRPFTVEFEARLLVCGEGDENNTFQRSREMEQKQTPGKKETENEGRPQSLFPIEEEPEGRREEAFHIADDGDELPFDVPRD